jgi:NitT/TauT family transport system substrate-binding protein
MQLTNQGIEKITQKKLKDNVIKASFDHITFTEDPIASSLQKSADNAKALGFLDSSDLSGIFDLTALNKARQADGQPAVAST